MDDTPDTTPKDCDCGRGPGFVLIDCDECGEPICSGCESEHLMTDCDGSDE
jgi:hypothetical protein